MGLRPSPLNLSLNGQPVRLGAFASGERTVRSRIQRAPEEFASIETNGSPPKATLLPLRVVFLENAPGDRFIPLGEGVPLEGVCNAVMVDEMYQPLAYPQIVKVESDMTLRVLKNA